MSIKVLHVISGDLWAGAEVQAFTQMVALQKRGLHVTAAVMNDGELATRLIDHGIETIIFPESQMGALTILRKLRTLLRDRRPDIVHTHRLKENILGAIASLCAGGIPSVRTVHGAPEHPPKGIFQLHKQILNYLNRWTGIYLQKKIIAVSSELRDKLALEFPNKKIVIIENGVDVESIRAQVRSIEFRQAALNATHVGIVGRLVPVKRVDLFLKTASMLRALDAHREWQFHVLGDGPLREALITQATALDIVDATTFHGHRDDITSCIAALDLVVICSDHEGLPMTLLEAMTVGTPVIGHDVGGVGSILSAINKNLLVADHTPAGYAKAVMDLLAMSTDANTALRKALFNNVTQYFSASMNAENIYRVYRQLAPKSS